MSIQWESKSPLQRLASRWGRTTVLFIAANVFSQLIGIATAVFLTYYLSPARFGQYAIALFYASMMTIVINAGSLQGTLMTVFGAADEDDAGDDDDSLLLTGAGFDRRRFLTSSVLCTALLAAVFVGFTVVFARPLTRAIFHGHASTEIVILAAVSGATGAPWRLAVNILRLERRVLAYCWFRMLRPVGALVVIVVLVSGGGGLTGALIGIAAGSIISIVPALITARRSYRFAFHPGDFARALRRGLPYIPVTICAGFVHGAGVYLLAGYRGNAEVGRFSVASSMSSINSHYISGFLTSYSPIRRTSLFAAAEHDSQRLKRRLINVFVVTSLFVFVSVSLLADELIRVSPTAYSSAANIVPYALVGWTGFGFYMLIYRIAELPRKRVIYVCVSVMSVAMYVGFSALLDPSLGAPGQGIAMGLTYAATASVVLVFSQLGTEPLPMDSPRIIAAVVLATGSVLAFHRIANALPGWRLAVELAGIAVYVLGLTTCRVVPRSVVLALRRTLIAMLPRRGLIRDVQSEIDQLESPQDRILRSLSRTQDPAKLAADLGLGESEFELRTVAGLRRLAGLGGPRACDVRIGVYLLSRESVAERDVLARRLWTEIDPNELDLLESTLRLVQRAANRRTRSRLLFGTSPRSPVSPKVAGIGRHG